VQLKIDNTIRPVRLLQITDCHLGDKLLGLDTEESLVDVLRLIGTEQDSPDLLLATGDIAGCYSLSAYQRFLALTRTHVSAPMVWLPGNHDTPTLMLEALQGIRMPRVITAGSWVLIMLDSSVRGSEHGDFTQEELTFLDQTIKDHSEYHVMIFLHHQPIAVGSAWVDQYVVRSADKFFAIVDRYPQIRGISWGHVHQEFYCRRKRENGILMWSTPSTCVQFKPQCDDFVVDHKMPGYRWYDLFADGSIVSHVSRVAEKPYSIDYDSSGY